MSTTKSIGKRYRLQQPLGFDNGRVRVRLFLTESNDYVLASRFRLTAVALNPISDTHAMWNSAVEAFIGLGMRVEFMDAREAVLLCPVKNALIPAKLEQALAEFKELTQHVWERLGEQWDSHMTAFYTYTEDKPEALPTPLDEVIKQIRAKDQSEIRNKIRYIRRTMCGIRTYTVMQIFTSDTGRCILHLERDGLHTVAVVLSSVDLKAIADLTSSWGISINLERLVDEKGTIRCAGSGQLPMTLLSKRIGQGAVCKPSLGVLDKFFHETQEAWEKFGNVTFSTACNCEVYAMPLHYSFPIAEDRVNAMCEAVEKVKITPTSNTRATDQVDAVAGLMAAINRDLLEESKTDKELHFLAQHQGQMRQRQLTDAWLDTIWDGISKSLSIPQHIFRGEAEPIKAEEKPPATVTLCRVSSEGTQVTTDIPLPGDTETLAAWKSRTAVGLPDETLDKLYQQLHIDRAKKLLGVNILSTGANRNGDVVIATAAQMAAAFDKFRGAKVSHTPAPPVEANAAEKEQATLTFEQLAQGLIDGSLSLVLGQGKALMLSKSDKHIALTWQVSNAHAPGAVTMEFCRAANEGNLLRGDTVTLATSNANVTYQFKLRRHVPQGCKDCEASTPSAEVGECVYIDRAGTVTTAGGVDHTQVLDVIGVWQSAQRQVAQMTSHLPGGRYAAVYTRSGLGVVSEIAYKAEDQTTVPPATIFKLGILGVTSSPMTHPEAGYEKVELHVPLPKAARAAEKVIRNFVEVVESAFAEFINHVH